MTAQEGDVIFETERTITPEGLGKSGARLLPPKAVLLTSRATVGAVAMAGVEMATNQGFASLIAGPEAIPEFLAIWCQHNRVEFEIRASGSTFPEISKSLVKDVPVLLPPLVVQRRVVDLVDAVDTYAAAAAARAAAAQAIRSALLAELLVGGDGWVATDLGSVAEWFSGGTPKAGTREFYAEGTVPWVVIGDLNDGPITSTATKITEAGLAEIGGRTAPPGSVLVSMYGTIGRLGIAETDLATNQAIAWGVVSDSVLPEYLFLWLSFTQPELDAKARGATQRNINRRIIRDHHILVPALAEQQRIVDLVGAAGDEADRAAEAEEAALSLRSALLDELLSGECEIPGSYDELVGLVA